MQDNLKAWTAEWEQATPMIQIKSEIPRNLLSITKDTWRKSENTVAKTLWI